MQDLEPPSIRQNGLLPSFLPWNTLPGYGPIHKPLKYIFSFYGVIDFLAIIPTYLDLIFAGAMTLAVIRGLRLLRIFRILKITRYSREGRVIVEALKASRVKILVFLFAVVMVVLVIGTLMYLIEGKDSGFTSIPAGIYWAIVTLTTVGFGDITPVTTLGEVHCQFCHDPGLWGHCCPNRDRYI